MLVLNYSRECYSLDFSINSFTVSVRDLVKFMNMMKENGPLKTLRVDFSKKISIFETHNETIKCGDTTLFTLTPADRAK